MGPLKNDKIFNLSGDKDNYLGAEQDIIVMAMSIRKQGGHGPHYEESCTWWWMISEQIRGNKCFYLRRLVNTLR